MHLASVKFTVDQFWGLFNFIFFFLVGLSFIHSVTETAVEFRRIFSVNLPTVKLKSLPPRSGSNFNTVILKITGFRSTGPDLKKKIHH